MQVSTRGKKIQLRIEIAGCKFKLEPADVLGQIAGAERQSKSRSGGEREHGSDQ